MLKTRDRINYACVELYPESFRAFKMRMIFSAIFSSILLLMPPLTGVFLAGLPIERYLEFPPRTMYVRHAGASWPVFAALAIVLCLFLYPFVSRFLAASPGAGSRHSGQRWSYPWWGRIALAVCLASWLLSWTRFPWFQSFQPYTFIPLWCSFVFVLNAVCHRLKGSSLVERHPWRFAALFPLSSIFWWYFEFLNRFVQNWHYLGVDDFSPAGYCITASLSFSTVLPAVLSMNELLKVFPRFKKAFGNFVSIRMSHPVAVAAAVLFFSTIGLLAMGILPDFLFPLPWVAPLIIVTAVNRLLGLPTVCEGIENGDWSGLCRLAAAGLVCGFFWEMWNYYSYAKWIYSIPYVGQLRIFEMPLLGYAGYLPFGIECGLVSAVILGLNPVLHSESCRSGNHAQTGHLLGNEDSND